MIKGVETLTGACVCAADLRAGTALAVAGLAAQGSTTIENVCLIDRGWQDMEEKLRSLGADIREKAEKGCPAWKTKKHSRRKIRLRKRKD